MTHPQSIPAIPGGGKPAGPDSELARFEALIGTLAARTLHLAPAELDRGIQAGLEAMGAFSGAHRVYLFQLEAGGTRMFCDHEWCAAGVEPRMREVRDFETVRLPWLFRQLRGLRVVRTTDIRKLPAEAAADQTVLGELGIRSFLAIPVGTRQELYGFIGFHSLSGRTQWPERMVPLLRLVGESLANALARRNAEHELERSRSRFEAVLNGANDGLWEWDAENGTSFFSPRWREMFGYSDADLAYERFDWKSIVHPDDLPEVMERIQAHLQGRTPISESIHRLRHRDGHYLWVLSRTKAQRGADGHLRRLTGLEMDITELRRYREALSQAQARAQVTLESIGEAVLTLDIDGRIDYLNPAAEKLLGYPRDSATGALLADSLKIRDPRTGESLERFLNRALTHRQKIEFAESGELERADGRRRRVEVFAAPLDGGEGGVTGAVVVLRDVTEAHDLHERLAWQANHDPLTGLVNRRAFEEVLREAIESAAVSDEPHTLCYLDLDQFKVVNDTCGHIAGDKLLGQLGELLAAQVGKHDVVARLGGDEFGILLRHAGQDRARELAERLREAIEHFRFAWRDRMFRLGVSIGVVPLNARSGDVTEALSLADSACYAAKEAGRNRVHVVAPDDPAMRRRQREMLWVNRISLALDDARFQLYRQAIHALQGEPRPRYEILLRLRAEDGSLITPEAFIGPAERYGVMQNLDRWVVEVTLGWLAERPECQDTIGGYAVNLSGQSLGDSKFLNFVVDALDRADIDPGLLCFEITETAAISNLSQALKLMETLRGLGCKFALDDFGSGLSSFAYLKNLPVDYLKIDGSFVRDMLSDPVDREMVRSINEIAHLLGKQTIAEYAESEAVVAALRDMGVDYAQGFGIQAPEFMCGSGESD